MKQVIFLALALVLIIGCASLGETISGIASNPAGYISEATEAANNTAKAIPELPYVVCVGIGYLSSFLRRWYSNRKRKQALDTP